jgi:phosphoglycolate phosphatase
MIRAAVFDFDGTLAEPVLQFSQMRERLDLLALEYVSPGILGPYRGVPILEMVDQVDKNLGTDGPTFRREALTLLEAMEVAAVEGDILFPYTRSVLNGLHRMGLKTGIMTRNCRGAVRKAFPDLDNYVDAMATREDVPFVKPHPDHPEAVLRRIGIDPSNAIIIGDHPTDIAAGLALGTHTVGVLTGSTTSRDLETAGAGWVVADIRQVPFIVAERLSV